MAVDPTAVARFALAARAAYLEGIARRAALSAIGLDLVSETATSYAARSLTETVVGFQGTNTPGDFLTDARIIAVGSPRIHAGFRDRWAHYVPWYLSVLKMDLPKPITTLGHSLGAGEACLAAYCFPERVEAVYTYGSPRIGLGEFVVQYGKLGFQTVRVVHDEDVVPMMPVLPYAHVCSPLRLNDQGVVIGPLKNWFRELLGLDRAIDAIIDGQALAQHHVDSYVDITARYATPTLQGTP